MELVDLVQDIGTSIKRIDERRPQASSPKGRLYNPGIGPHPETQAVNLIVAELTALVPERYAARLQVAVAYPSGRQKCDLCVGSPPD